MLNVKLFCIPTTFKRICVDFPSDFQMNLRALSVYRYKHPYIKGPVRFNLSFIIEKFCALIFVKTGRGL